MNASNLPPGVTESMIPGNYVDDTSERDARIAMMALCVRAPNVDRARLAIWAAELRETASYFARRLVSHPVTLGGLLHEIQQSAADTPPGKVWRELLTRERLDLLGCTYCGEVFLIDDEQARIGGAYVCESCFELENELKD